MDYQTFMDGIEAEAVFRNFYNISMVPRMPGKQQEISDYMVRFAQKLGFAYEQDKALNVIIRKPASSGMEDHPSVMITAHLDMVCEKTAESNHDFTKDPLTLIREDDLVRANKTTLGADDGIGVAMIMAILEDTELKHPPIEAVFTTDEETDMGGALNLDYSKLISRTVINLDGFAVGCSCTGELEVYMHIPKELVSTKTELTGYSITVDGLTGGHTGMQGMEQKGNANTLLNRVLTELGKHTDYQLLSFNGGNGMSSAFASHACCEVALSDSQCLEEAAEKCLAGFRDELAIRDPGVKVHINQLPELPKEAFSDETKHRLCSLLTIAPDGIFTFSARHPGRFEGASNLGVVQTKDNEIFATCLIRNRVTSIKYYLLDKLEALCSLLGIRLEIEHELAQWDDNMSDDLKKVLEEIYPDKIMEHFDGTLECGLFYSNLPGSVVVSLAPTFYQMHSPQEHVFISEVACSYERLQKLLGRL